MSNILAAASLPPNPNANPKARDNAKTAPDIAIIKISTLTCNCANAVTIPQTNIEYLVTAEAILPFILTDLEALITIFDKASATNTDIIITIDADKTDGI
ncbi:MAG: hypothetical protein QM532_01745 [Cyanobium sp. MAG06]|nr:hypothetical protein [Cyanobium sp. MAG06]